MKSPEAQVSSSFPARDLSVERDRRIGVGVLIYSSGYGGADTIVLNWLKAMDRDRFRSYLFAFETLGEQKQRFLDKAAEMGVTVYQVPWSRRKPLLRATRSMVNYIRRFDLDILHCHNPYADFVGVLVKRYVQVKTVTTFHAWGESGIRLKILEQLHVRTSRFFDQLTAASEAARRGAVERSIPAERIKVLRICTFASPVQFPPEERAARRARLSVQPDDVVLISIARFFVVKRYDVMLQAFRQILDRCPNTRLWMVGDGPEETKMKRLAAQLGITDCAQFLGYRADVMELLALADLQLLTSDIEGLPMAILEGMAAALPIVATKVGSLPEILVHGHSALLVNPGRPEEVAAAALDLIENSVRRRSLGVEASLLSERLYAPQKGAASVAEIYENLIVAKQ
jgi:glycosyltransferase involved in cell wall biosynthesis